jgi:serine/threonine-protein kinase HipA
MSANGKRQDHNRTDLIAVGANVTKLPHSLMHEMIDNVVESVSQWKKLAKQEDVPKGLRREIEKNLPLRDFRR